MSEEIKDFIKKNQHFEIMENGKVYIYIYNLYNKHIIDN